MTSTRSAPASGVWAPIRRTALAKVVVMGVTGVFGLVNTRLIISHFGTDAYAQYGLLATFPNLMPFTDLGIGAVILNSVAGSSDLRHDAIVRRTLTTAIRVLLASALIIATTGVVLGLAGLWPTLLGAKLMDGGGVTATLCLVVYAAALPLSVGQRIVVGMGRSATQVISQGIVSPALTCMLLLAVVVRLEAGNAVSVMSYVANTLVSIVCVVVAWRTTRPLLSQALRDVPRLREVRGVRIVDTAGPSLVQALIIPIAFQTDRLLLSHLGGGQTLAQYNLAAQMFNLLTQTVSVTGMAMWPHFAKARADGRGAEPRPGPGGAVDGLRPVRWEDRAAGDAAGGQYRQRRRRGRQAAPGHVHDRPAGSAGPDDPRGHSGAHEPRAVLGAHRPSGGGGPDRRLRHRGDRVPVGALRPVGVGGSAPSPRPGGRR